MIEKIRLLNFVSHSETSLELKEGITVFVGKNGAGKSSVIDGITYALYGKHTRTSNDNLVRRGTNRGSASVEFSSAGRRYSVERKLNDKGQLEGGVLKEFSKGSAKQLASGERRQFGESLSAEVSKVMGLDYERMRVAAIIQQGELDKIVGLTPKETKDLVNGLIGIDQLDIAHGSMLELITSFRSAVKEKYGYDNTDVQALKKSIEDNEALVSSCGQRLRSLSAELDALRAREASLQQEIKALEPLKTKVELLRMELEKFVDYVSQERRELEQEHKELTSVVEKSAEYLQKVKDEGRISSELQRSNEEELANIALLEDLGAQISRLEALVKEPEELSKLVRKARESRRLVDNEQVLRTTHEDLESKIADLDSNINRLTEEKGRYEGQREFAAKLEFRHGVCPVCGSKVERINDLFDVATIENHLSKHRSALVALTAEKRRLEPELKKAEKEVRALEEARTFLAENNIGGAEDIEELERRRDAIADELSGLAQKKALQTKATEDKNGIRARISDLRKQATDISIGRSYLTEHQTESEEAVLRLRKKTHELHSILEVLPSDLEKLRTASKVDIEGLSRLAFDQTSKQSLRRLSELSAETSRFDESVYAAKVQTLENLRNNVILTKVGDVRECQSQMERGEREAKIGKEALVVAERIADHVKVLEMIRAKVFHRDGPVSSSLRSWALEQIGAKASDYARLFGIGVSRISLRERARDIEIECHGLKGAVRVDSLSGGEKVAVALALRFAMAYVMGGYKLDFIILDEPTVHLDEERKASMVEIISSLGRATSPLKQIIIITHDSAIFENAEVEAVYRFEASATEGTRVRLGKTD